MWRKSDNIVIVNRGTRVPGHEALRVAPAVMNGALCYVIFDVRQPSQIITTFGDSPTENEGAIVLEARTKLGKYQWKKVRGLNGASWHVTLATLPLNRPGLYNVCLAPCVTDAGTPGLAMYDLEGIILFMGHFDDRLDIRKDKVKYKKPLYSLLMQTYYLDWQFDEEQ